MRELVWSNSFARKIPNSTAELLGFTSHFNVFFFLFSFLQDQCCWSCLKCREDAYVENDMCIVCDPGYAPTVKRDSCEKLEPQVIDWQGPWAMVPIIFASVGIFFTIFTVCVFIKCVFRKLNDFRFQFF